MEDCRLPTPTRSRRLLDPTRSVHSAMNDRPNRVPTPPADCSAPGPVRPTGWRRPSTRRRRSLLPTGSAPIRTSVPSTQDAAGPPSILSKMLRDGSSPLRQPGWQKPVPPIDPASPAPATTSKTGRPIRTGSAVRSGRPTGRTLAQSEARGVAPDRTAVGMGPSPFLRGTQRPDLRPNCFPSCRRQEFQGARETGYTEPRRRRHRSRRNDDT